ncbi:ABC transporter substrate-binding protein [Limnobacter parvus]|uniref:ABC transporter substrate-binding protein n=1 Tax=Limnobacter parvus TaxID=2939690 RepID=A0ABT1XJF5_9BURK|nr:ABC transporter substrate-binding protein [Limnobacter parvus]MCR2747410.1 ABC transporter substrate-binding protein [Limnobacter parvus]
MFNLLPGTIGDSRWFKSGVAALLFVAVAFCQTAWADNPRIAVSKSPLSLPFFVAKEKNLFAKHGVEPQLIECIGGNRCVQELVDGKVDMATSSELPFMFTVHAGKPITLITTFVNNKDDMKFLVRKSAAPEGIKSLAGKRVGYVSKSASHYFMDVFLLYHGLDPRTVVPVALRADELAGALAKGEVDAISVWEPWGQVALEMGGSKVEVVSSPRLYNQTFNLLVGNEYRLAESKRISAVLMALEDAIQLIKKNPDEAMRTMARVTGVSMAIVKAAWPTYRFELSLQQSLLTTIQGQARWAKREGHVAATNTDPEFLDFIDSSLLRKLNPSAVDFVYR